MQAGAQYHRRRSDAQAVARNAAAEGAPVIATDNSMDIEEGGLISKRRRVRPANPQPFSPYCDFWESRERARQR